MQGGVSSIAVAQHEFTEENKSVAKLWEAHRGQYMHIPFRYGNQSQSHSAAGLVAKVQQKIYVYNPGKKIKKNGE